MYDDRFIYTKDINGDLIGECRYCTKDSLCDLCKEEEEEIQLYNRVGLDVYEEFYYQGNDL